MSDTREREEALERPAEFGETALAEIGTRLWRGRWWIVGFGVLGLIAGILLVSRRDTVYEALARIYVEQPSKELMGADAFLMAASSKNFANTQAQIVRSGRVLRQVLELPEIRQSEIFGEVDNPLAALRKGLQVSVGRTDDVISVSLESEHVEEACFIVNQVVRRYQEQQGKATRETAQSRIGDLQARLKTLDQEVQSNLDAQKTLIRKLGLGDGADEEGSSGSEPSAKAALSMLARTDPDAMRRVFSNRDRAQLEADEARERHDEAQELYAAGGVVRESLALAASPQLASVLSRRTGLIERSFELEEEIEKLLGETKLSATHPRVTNKQKLRARIASELEGLTQQVERAAKAELERLSRAAEAAQEDFERFDAECQLLMKQEPELQIAQLELSQLQRDGELKFELAKQLRTQIADLAMGDARSIESEEDSLSVLILDSADPKTARIVSSRVRLVALFLFLGLLMGGGIAWLRQSLDQTLRSVDDLEFVTRLPVLGQTPIISAEEQEMSAAELWEANESLAESVRALRTAIRFGGGKQARMLQVTSPEQSDGKSLTTAMLAIALAEAGQRVLLLDADLRRPRVCKLFPRSENPMLWEEIAGWDFDGEHRPQVLETAFPRLSVIGSSHRPKNPGAILTSPGFLGLLEWIKASADFDTVLIDSPPILPVADARVIAQHCDQSLLVGRALSSTRSVVRHAENEMRKAEISLLGWVLNGVRRDAKYGGYYHYRYRTEAEG
jgi:succinoglycan biosynthesis transport protein ExoP